MKNADLIKQILALKREKNAIILAHNYQNKDIQKISDFVGESYELGVKALNVKEDIVVCCAVSFMAEMVYILNPTKKVILPNLGARCPMADMITELEVLKLKEKYKGYKFIGYMNTNADIKQHLDACCTASNAIRLIKNIDSDKIVFLPDKNLVEYIKKEVKDKEIISWNGCCRVHDNITAKEVLETKKEHPDAMLVVHPECNSEVAALADKILGTGEMLEYVKNSEYKKFLIGTEEGMLYRLNQVAPDKTCYLASRRFVCPNMKKIKLIDIYTSLKEEKNIISLDPEVKTKCKKSFDAMFQWS